MIYENIHPGRFVSRPNRFIALVDIDGAQQICHVKNTGRCKELLLPGSRVILQKMTSSGRKTEYDLIAVYKENRLINIDSQAPNRLFAEWVRKDGLFHGAGLIKAEQTYKNSRFDYYLETKNERIFVEVKGVTLEEDGVALFPDAPTERGVKHLRELAECIGDGFAAYIVFVIQMKGVSCFTPNSKTHPAFKEALCHAVEQGVQAVAVDCDVAEDSIQIAGGVKIVL